MRGGKASLTAAAIGECMIEFAAEGGRTAEGGHAAEGSGVFRQSFAGDTVNTAIYLSRLGARTRFFTAVGKDPLSRQMRAFFRQHGVDDSTVIVHPARRAGLYVILGGGGARNFYYWRNESAAREMLRLPQSRAALAKALQADWCLLSGITLAILPSEDRQTLRAALVRRRQSGLKIALDLNYRPACWESAAAARAALVDFYPLLDLIFGGDEDIAGLYQRAVGDGLALLPAAAEVVLRENGVGVHLRAKGGKRRFAELDFDAKPLDPTAAGDSFNAAYLFARVCRRKTPRPAALLAHDFARRIVNHRGAIAPAAATADAALMG